MSGCRDTTSCSHVEEEVRFENKIEFASTLNNILNVCTFIYNNNYYYVLYLSL